MEPLENTFAGPWILSLSLISALREDGIIPEATFQKVLRNMRTAALIYEERGETAAAAEVRRDADELESTHLTASGLLRGDAAKP